MTHTVAVIAFAGISPFHLSVPCIVFGENPARLRTPCYRVLLCALKAGVLPTMSGFDIVVPHDLSILTGADTVIVPSWHSNCERPPQVLLDALCEAHDKGGRLVGLCLGAFVLAEAGLLRGRRASTHWAWVEDFARMYPDVRLDANALYVDEGNILTSAGTGAALDCCLHIVRRDHGAEIANRLARQLVVPPHRHGGQAQYIEKPLSVHAGADRLTATLEWALAHLDGRLCTKKLADHARMSLRSFTRHFKNKTGTTLTQWLLNQRLIRARRLLETQKYALETIAEMSGFASVVTFRQHFTRVFSVSPGLYRRQFQMERPQ